MPQRSKVLTQLPPELRKELDKRLVEGSFTKYRPLEQWLAERGYRISKSSLQRYGDQFESRIKSVTLATAQARALTEASPDSEGAMNDALERLVQEKIFGVLIEVEDIPDGQLARLARAVADLGRTSVSQKRWAEQMRERLAEQKRAAEAKIGALKQSGGISDEAYEAMRSALLGIDPLAAS